VTAVAVILFRGAVLGTAFVDIRAGQFDDRCDGAEILALAVAEEAS
jgi:hypothetical protein